MRMILKQKGQRPLQELQSDKAKSQSEIDISVWYDIKLKINVPCNTYTYDVKSKGIFCI